VTPEWVVDLSLGQEGFELLPENGLLLMYGGRAGTGILLLLGKLGELPA
jgi:hypothetical protein